WANLSDHRGDEQRTTWDVLAPVILDQLAELTTAHVVDTFVQPFQNEDGFLALITLKGGTVVQLDLRRRSLVGLQTGWMLEGDRGGYARGRIYTPTNEGEIVDEAVSCEPVSRDGILTEFMTRCSNPTPDNERHRGEWVADLFVRLRNAAASK